MKKVVIIGAGPAGVTAGYELLKNREDSEETYEVLILERQPHGHRRPPLFQQGQRCDGLVE